MNKLLRTLWCAVVSGACVFAMVGKAEAAVTIDPSGDIDVTKTKTGLFYVIDNTDGDDHLPAQLVVHVDESYPVVITFSLNWRQTENLTSPALALQISGLSGGAATLTGVTPLSPLSVDTSPAGPASFWSRTYQLTVAASPGTTITIDLVYAPGTKTIGGTVRANASLPEPATVVLLGSGLAGIVAARQRQKRRKAA